MRAARASRGFAAVSRRAVAICVVVGAFRGLRAGESGLALGADDGLLAGGGVELVAAAQRGAHDVAAAGAGQRLLQLIDGLLCLQRRRLLLLVATAHLGALLLRCLLRLLQVVLAHLEVLRLARHANEHFLQRRHLDSVPTGKAVGLKGGEKRRETVSGLHGQHEHGLHERLARHDGALDVVLHQSAQALALRGSAASFALGLRRAVCRRELALGDVQVVPDAVRLLQLERRRFAFDLAVDHDGCVVAKHLGFFHRVGSHQDDAALLLQVANQATDGHLALCVNAGRRLVKDHKSRVADHRDAQRQPALLPTAEFRGLEQGRGALVESRGTQRRVRHLLDVGEAMDAGEQLDVVARRQIRVERVALRNEPDARVAAAEPTAGFVENCDVADVALESQHAVNQRRLASAIVAQQHGHLPCREAQAHVVHGHLVLLPRQHRRVRLPDVGGDHGVRAVTSHKRAARAAAAATAAAIRGVVHQDGDAEVDDAAGQHQHDDAAQRHGGVRHERARRHGEPNAARHAHGHQQAGDDVEPLELLGQHDEHEDGDAADGGQRRHDAAHGGQEGVVRVVEQRDGREDAVQRHVRVCGDEDDREKRAGAAAIVRGQEPHLVEGAHRQREERGRQRERERHGQQQRHLAQPPVPRLHAGQPHHGVSLRRRVGVLLGAVAAAHVDQLRRDVAQQRPRHAQRPDRVQEPEQRVHLQLRLLVVYHRQPGVAVDRAHGQRRHDVALRGFVAQVGRHGARHEHHPRQQPAAHGAGHVAVGHQVVEGGNGTVGGLPAEGVRVRPRQEKGGRANGPRQRRVHHQRQPHAGARALGRRHAVGVPGVVEVVCVERVDVLEAHDAVGTQAGGGGGGFGAAFFFIRASFPTSGFISTVTSAAANAGTSVTFFFSCVATFSSSHSSKPVTSARSASFSSVESHGFVSAKASTVFRARSTNAFADATASGLRSSSFARSIQSSPIA
mmetsp:Transcript_76087/g.184002  ORF Transcript_76087/g.184002 Transcript_76087/m.184002 type:complete len:962 (-) Transcript_76087:416-3301(-)